MTDFLELTPINLICAEIVGRYTKDNIAPNQRGIIAVLDDSEILEFRSSSYYIERPDDLKPGIYRGINCDGPIAFGHSNYPLAMHQLPEILAELEKRDIITIKHPSTTEEVAKGFDEYRYTPENPRHCPFWISFDELLPNESHTDYGDIIYVQNTSGGVEKISYPEAINNKENYLLWHPAYEGQAPFPPGAA